MSNTPGRTIEVLEREFARHGHANTGKWTTLYIDELAEALPGVVTAADKELDAAGRAEHATAQLKLGLPYLEPETWGQRRSEINLTPMQTTPG